MDAVYIFTNDPSSNAGAGRIGRIGLLRGPYATADDARVDYEETVRYVNTKYVWAAFWGFGIAAFDTDKPGKLNVVFAKGEHEQATRR